jgi:hypothetical protein
MLAMIHGTFGVDPAARIVRCADGIDVLPCIVCGGTVPASIDWADHDADTSIATSQPLATERLVLPRQVLFDIGGLDTYVSDHVPSTSMFNKNEVPNPQ